ncbi:glycine betaine ABC transporter substrate-binding protein [Amycolatopsis sp. K13G38]|uniref:Glycine betaine ABC transporter substrate-binding protein n=1 Tax=Amycolatopsis acididurans TaxID=2724524 RepID=A0ABX1J2Z7_9PSEU|nr:glycine betaine ABC transporter substrate-binding protein [Amycolatopsis acididurans]NKQ52735.1 glycine betaine ABC transporter substrate-binding protein [Amycolatopsis acididurans]
MSSGRLRRLGSLIAAVLAVALVASACGGRNNSADTGQSNKTLKIGYIAWDEDIALSNLVKGVLEDKGYKVELQQLDAAPLYAGLAKGDIDLFLDSWLPSTHEDYWNQYKNKLEDLGVWYNNATLNLAVPNSVSQVNSIEDLKTNASLFGGKITGIDPGAGETRIIQNNVMPQYDLAGSMQLQNSSSTAMLAALDSAIKGNQPIVVALWHPHWAYSRYPLKDLADPKGAMGKGEQLHSLGRQNFAKDFPNLANSLKNLKLTDEQLGSLEDAVQKAGNGNEATAAKQWAAQNKQLVDSIFTGV